LLAQGDASWLNFKSTPDTPSNTTRFVGIHASYTGLANMAKAIPRAPDIPSSHPLNGDNVEDRGIGGSQERDRFAAIEDRMVERAEHARWTVLRSVEDNSLEESAPTDF
jgi:hypothetical protein